MSKDRTTIEKEEKLWRELRTDKNNKLAKWVDSRENILQLHTSYLVIQPYSFYV